MSKSKQSVTYLEACDDKEGSNVSSVLKNPYWRINRSSLAIPQQGMLLEETVISEDHETNFKTRANKALQSALQTLREMRLPSEKNKKGDTRMKKDRVVFFSDEFQLLRRDISLIYRTLKEGRSCGSLELERILQELDKKKEGKRYEQQVID